MYSKIQSSKIHRTSQLNVYNVKKQHYTSKSRLLPLLLLLLIFFQACNQKPHYRLSEVKTVLEKQLLCWNKGDLKGFMQGYLKDSSVRFITKKGVKTHWDDILSGYQKSYPTQEKMGCLTFYTDEIRWIDSTAGISLVIGRWQITKLHEPSQIIESSANKNNKIHANSIENTSNSVNKTPSTTDTFSGQFSLIFAPTQEGPKIQIDHTW